jgi:DNA-binding response OmpR family regulator
LAASVLIIDDDQGVTDSFARILRLEGHQVRTAATGAAGLQQAEACHPDAIIVDLQMPLVDGAEFLRQLRARPTLKETPVAIVTGNYFLEDATAVELNELGAKLLYKPLWLEDLVSLTNKLLDSRPPTGNTVS